MMYTRKIAKRVRELVHDPVFQKPISELKKDYSQRGQIILVTKIKPQWNTAKETI